MNLGEVEDQISTEEQLDVLLKANGGHVEEKGDVEEEEVLEDGEQGTQESGDQNENAGNILFGCNTCGDKFRTHNDLKCHTATHLVQREESAGNVCSPCKKTFKSQEELASHLKWEHELCMECLKLGRKCAMCKRAEDIRNEREGARKRQLSQADKMLSNTAKKVKVCEVGDAVMVPVPSVDRGKIDQPHLPAIIMEDTGMGQFKLGTRFSSQLSIILSYLLLSFIYQSLIFSK